MTSQLRTSELLELNGKSLHENSKQSSINELSRNKWQTIMRKRQANFNK